MMNTQAALSTIFQYEKFMPHGYCLLWQPDLVWTYVISDLAITIAYYSIPLMILYMVRRNRQSIPFRWVYMLFALFIFLCGTTHLLDIITLWYPMYYLQGVVKALTAAASLVTAILVFPLVPLLLNLFRELEQKGINPWQKEKP